jgi:putative PIN family toxin of toxin-antitoxin system
MSGAPRAVLDTNVVLSALLFASGRLAPLRDAWRDARCRPLVSIVTITELLRALTYPKFKLSAAEQRELLADYLPFCETVRMPPTPPKTPECRDPYDVPFLQLAVAGKADCLVTGDRHLLALAGRFSRPIVRPEQFLSSLGSG